MKIILLVLLVSFQSFGKAKPYRYLDIQNTYTNLNADSQKLVKLFFYSRDREKLRAEVMKRGAEATPALTTVMKDSRFNERNRWTATFLLGQVVGKKSKPFLRKFTTHPNWLLRLASLKTLTALGDKNRKIYQNLLEDSSLIVRLETLTSIESLNIKSLGNAVFKMLKNKNNYVEIGNKFERSEIIKKAVLVLGQLKHQEALKFFRKALNEKEYIDIRSEMKLALSMNNQSKRL